MTNELDGNVVNAFDIEIKRIRKKYTKEPKTLEQLDLGVIDMRVALSLVHIRENLKELIK